PIDWSFSENGLNQLRNSRITPIVGLVHHGSGPNNISFFDQSFEKGLASYALQVAERFPWIEYYTPVNDPLTTARFCGLYGLWYPHKADEESFLKVLVSECKGTVMAMQAIRTVNPEAKLVLTEDLGKIHSSELLNYQAEFENHRRWLSIDLLCGNVTPAHPLWKHLISMGISQGDLYFFIDNPCPPDICGFNYYVTSERYLDEKLHEYPEHTHGGNGQHQYADVEVVRVAELLPDGPYKLLKEAWTRFRLPLAITEAHLGCTREEQLRWFASIWDAGKQLRAEGIPFLAVTAWALSGNYNWCHLLTKDTGHYETGVYDVRSGRMRPTALAQMIRAMARGEEFDHPVLELAGWWQRDCRVIYPNHYCKQKPDLKASRPVIILGKTGTLGKAFARICETRAISHHLLGRDDVNLSDPKDIARMIGELKPWAIINAAGFVRVDDAETECEMCLHSNADIPGLLAELCLKHQVKLLTFSSDLVFDGLKQQCYVESDPVSPINVYGQSKVLAEQNVMTTNPKALVIRTSAFFGPWDMYNFAFGALQSFQQKLPFRAAHNIWISPTYVPDLVNNSLDLLLDDASGVWHLT
ncbi:MAG TPA: sugar nucleotide-binding protein, partial [Sphingobacteriaceae bacterium]